MRSKPTIEESGKVTLYRGMANAAFFGNPEMMSIYHRAALEFQRIEDLYLEQSSLLSVEDRFLRSNTKTHPAAALDKTLFFHLFNGCAQHLDARRDSIYWAGARHGWRNALAKDEENREWLMLPKEFGQALNNVERQKGNHEKTAAIMVDLGISIHPLVREMFEHNLLDTNSVRSFILNRLSRGMISEKAFHPLELRY